MKLYSIPKKSDINEALDVIKDYAKREKYVIHGTIDLNADIFPVFQNVHYDSKSLMKRVRDAIHKVKSRPTLSRCNHLLILIFIRVYKQKGHPNITLNPYQAAVINCRKSLQKRKQELQLARDCYRQSKINLKLFNEGRPYITVIKPLI